MTTAIDTSLISHEWPELADGSVYLNNGSCGRKPKAVLQALGEGMEECNLNPTLYTFFSQKMRDETCQAAAELFAVPAENLMLTAGTTSSLQFLMQSFLEKEGDELVTTTHEHGSVKAICRFLEESRGIKVHRYDPDPMAGSQALHDGVINLVSKKTKLVLVSEIDCFSGWRPDLAPLVESLKDTDAVFLADGAHSPGQGPCRPAQYPLWVGSGHKWLGGPNGTGFAYIAPHLVPRLKPLVVGDRLYDFYEGENLARFEWTGTSDQIRFSGLKKAVELCQSLGENSIARRQQTLIGHLRKKLGTLGGTTIRTPQTNSEQSGMLTVNWNKESLKVSDLQKSLWEHYRIWVQPDYFYGEPGHGMRISCHVSTSEAEIDKLIEAVRQLLR